MKRYLTLYYASISLTNSILSVLWWFICFWRNPAKSRSILIDLIERNYQTGSWFIFGSARSSLAAFLRAADIGNDDQVIISSYTCLAVSTAIVSVGAVPVYIDINSLTLNIDESSIWPAVTDKTKAIIIQHTLGNPAAIIEIRHKAHAQGLIVIEDCALSMGTKDSGRYVGTLGDAAIFSMELSKILSCGWGGLLLINNYKLASVMTRVYSTVPEQPLMQSTADLVQTVISTWCNYPTLVKFPGRYVMWLCEKIGFFRQSTPLLEFEGVVASNFIQKMGGAQTLLAILQWRNFREVTDQCAANHMFFTRELKALGFIVHDESKADVTLVANRVSFLVKSPKQMIDFFRRERVDLGVWFDGPLSPLPKNVVFNYQPGSYHRAEQVAVNVINIPCHNRLSINDKVKIVATLRLYTKAHPDAQCVNLVPL
jgi:dTDP-4-amino-4,6-dideoxygalactose transaminase